jgi:hypothetical protein
MEVVGEGIHLLAAAHPPALSKRRRTPAMPVLLMSAACLVFALAAIVALLGSSGLGWPSVIALGVPQSAPPGIVNAFYAIRGHAAVTYQATASNGTVVASGSLPASSGTLALAIPASVAGHSVRLTVDANGPFGHDTRSAGFDISPAQRSATLATAQIRALTAHRETYAGSESVLASYAAMGVGGVLRILDQHGKTLGSVPFTHVGTSRIALAGDTRGQSLRAELHVARGASHADAAVEIPAQGDGELKAAGVLAAALRAGDASAAAAAQAVPSQDSGSIPLPSDPFYVAERVVGGNPLRVSIRNVLPHMHVELQDDMGTTLDDAAVAPGARVVTLNAPAVTTVQTYYLAGTFVKASGEETLVRSVRIFPR